VAHSRRIDRRSRHGGRCISTSLRYSDTAIARQSDTKAKVPILREISEVARLSQRSAASSMEDGGGCGGA
jgi:hypothetical protein